MLFFTVRVMLLEQVKNDKIVVSGKWVKGVMVFKATFNISGDRR
jgi:cytoskeletal protein CcmA (bactofilin family)